ncbi:MAG TPA: TetR/AcrR family transcriptional regulator [Myxococcaceae bacterium]|nr:TetR/AcrR family transcriptional regulator [Myxococcaceae bacterium]
MTHKKLPKARRRGQLLETAYAIVREEGTEALTLGRLAERAGVSKPIAYEHFGTRSGLLMALYKEIDERHIAALVEALSRAPRRLEDVARVASDAYMACYSSTGPQAHAIAAALQGDGEMDAFHQGLVDNYVKLYCDMLAPYSDLSKKALHLHCVGLVGAADAISREMIRARVSEETAATTLASLIVKTLSAPRRA